MARLYHVIVVLLLLESLSTFGEEASNPGFVARITGKGLEYGKGTELLFLRPTAAYQNGVVTRTMSLRLAFVHCLV